MFVRKLLVLVATVVVSTSALAVGSVASSEKPDFLTPDSKTGVYVGINANWAQQDYSLNVVRPDKVNAAGTTGELGWGLDVGYAFNKNWALELGGLFPPDVIYADNSATPRVNYTFKTWNAYLAGKGTVPLYKNLGIFLKLGLAYIHTSTPTAASLASVQVAGVSQGEFGPMLGLGLDYEFYPHLSFDIQEILVLSTGPDSKTTTPTMGGTYTPGQSFTAVGLTYSFAS